MSNQQNDIYLESVQENFETAVANEDWALARDIIKDLRDEGFDKQAAVLERELVATQNEDTLI